MKNQNASKQETDAPTSTRRTFLGAAAAALATIPATATATDTDAVDVETDDTGSARATVPNKNEVWSALNIRETVDDATTFSVTGHWSDGAPAQVECVARTDVADMTFNLSPAEADELAADLKLAATHARQGATELEGDQ